MSCDFPDCDRPHFAKGWCHPHYEQGRRGTPLRPVRSRRDPNATRVRDDQGRKWCPKCSLWVAPAQFVPDPSHSDGLSTYCKACRSAHARAWRYGLTPDDLARMVHDQDGHCLACPTVLADGFCVDHDHACCPGQKTCGECVRGLLCEECNKLLGKIEQDPDRLARLLAYAGLSPEGA